MKTLDNKYIHQLPPIFERLPIALQIWKWKWKVSEACFLKTIIVVLFEWKLIIHITALSKYSSYSSADIQSTIYSIASAWKSHF